MLQTDKEYDAISVSRKGRTIYFFDNVDNRSVCQAIKLIHDLEEESKKSPIQLTINSSGGSVYDGLALYDKLRNSDCEIITIGTGLVASMGLIIFLAGDQRLLTENTRLLNHQMTSSIEGKVTDIAIDLTESRILENLAIDIIATTTGLSKTKIEKEIKIGDKWFSAEQALLDGYATGIISNKKPSKKRRNKKK